MNKNIFFKALLVFLAFIVVTFSVGNYVLYKSIVHVFGIISPQTQSGLGWSLFILSFGFVVVMIIEKKVVNKFVKIIYGITSTWIGMLIYLFIAACVYEIWRHLVGGGEFVGLLLFAIAIFISITGLIHGRDIFVKEVKIKLSNIPENWKGKNFVFVSDFHLGTSRDMRFTKRVVDLINKISPEIVCIGGDLFDGTHAIDAVKYAEPLKEIISKRGIYYVTGNHEEFANPEYFIGAIKNLGIRVLDDECVVLDGINLIGVDYSKNSKAEKFKETLSGMFYDKNLPTILLKHEPKDLNVSRESGINLQLSGHTHRGQQWPLNYVVYYKYKGYSYGLKDFDGMQIFVSSGVGGWGPKIRVGSKCEIVKIMFE